MNAVDFGLLVRDARKVRNLRQEDLAMIAGTSRKFVIDLEQGKQSCHLGLALLVASALGLELAMHDAASDPR